MTAFIKEINELFSDFDGRLGIWTAFKWKDAVRQIPSARWDPGRRCWTVHPDWRDEAERLVEAINERESREEVVVEVERQRAALAPQQVFTDLRTMLPDHLRDPMFRALIDLLEDDRQLLDSVMEAWTGTV